MTPDLEDLQQRLGYRFRRPELLEEALTHRSRAAERPPREAAADNERLEYVGDAVLGLAAARHLFETHPEAREGELSRLRARLVGQAGLAEAASRLGLDAHVRLGRGEERSGGAAKPSILAGAAEALAGAVFLDGGWRSAYRFARTLFRALERAGAAAGPLADAKTRLQELCQERHRETPAYALLECTGPAHQPTFAVEVRLAGRALARGEGGSRKAAEQAAAAGALEALDGERHNG